MTPRVCCPADRVAHIVRVRRRQRRDRRRRQTDAEGVRRAVEVGAAHPVRHHRLRVEVTRWPIVFVPQVVEWITAKSAGVVGLVGCRPQVGARVPAARFQLSDCAAARPEIASSNLAAAVTSCPPRPAERTEPRRPCVAPRRPGTRPRSCASAGSAATRQRRRRARVASST